MDFDEEIDYEADDVGKDQEIKLDWKTQVQHLNPSKRFKFDENNIVLYLQHFVFVLFFNVDCL